MLSFAIDLRGEDKRREGNTRMAGVMLGMTTRVCTQRAKERSRAFAEATKRSGHARENRRWALDAPGENPRSRMHLRSSGQDSVDEWTWPAGWIDGVRLVHGGDELFAMLADEGFHQRLDG